MSLSIPGGPPTSPGPQGHPFRVVPKAGSGTVEHLHGRLAQLRDDVAQVSLQRDQAQMQLKLLQAEMDAWMVGGWWELVRSHGWWVRMGENGGKMVGKWWEKV